MVYCTNVNCASIMAYNLLVQHGYGDVRRYAGGLDDWEEAGYPLVGEMAPRHDPFPLTEPYHASAAYPLHET